MYRTFDLPYISLKIQIKDYDKLITLFTNQIESI